MEFMKHFGIWCPLSAVLGLFFLNGCGKSDGIQSYRAPKPPARAALGSTAPEDQGTPAETKPARMLAAIVPVEGASWFFKLTGDPTGLAAVTGDFKQFVGSVRFPSEDKPTWKLPAEWEQKPGSGIRFATILVPQQDAEPAELSVTRLPGGSDNLEPALLSNVNRWRGQLNLDSVTPETLMDGLDKVNLTEKVDAYLMDFEGTSSSGGGMTPPFAGGMGRFPGRLPGGSPPAGAVPPMLARPNAGGNGNLPGNGPASDAESLDLTAPELWLAAQNDQFSLQAYEIKGDDGTARVTLSKMPARVPLQAQIPRWQRQVGLEPTGKLDGDNGSSEAVTVDGVDGQLLTFAGTKETTLLAAIRKDGWDWFIKIRGASPVVAAERERFETFVRSGRFNRTKE